MKNIIIKIILSLIFFSGCELSNDTEIKEGQPMANMLKINSANCKYNPILTKTSDGKIIIEVVYLLEWEISTVDSMSSVQLFSSIPLNIKNFKLTGFKAEFIDSYVAVIGGVGMQRLVQPDQANGFPVMTPELYLYAGVSQTSYVNPSFIGLSNFPLFATDRANLNTFMSENNVVIPIINNRHVNGFIPFNNVIVSDNKINFNLFFDFGYSPLSPDYFTAECVDNTVYPNLTANKIYQNYITFTFYGETL